MAYTICEPCVDTKDKACVDVCPVDCIYELEPQERSLYIHPDECIDCNACVPECPVDAIFPNDEVPEKWKSYIEANAQAFHRDSATREAELAKLKPKT
ncbi:MAG: ferredoxin family protein [Deltaproteobacteria bacterium]|nr:ferredoxin family protein [Deltaproteobacteria bacterium]